MFVTGLLLGADSAPQHGAPWQLRSYDGGTVLGAALDGARECGFDQLVVTLGSASEQIHDRIDLDGVRVVESPHADTGSASIVPALDAVDRRADGIVVLLGDQPGVTSAAVWSLVAEVRTPIGVCRYDDGDSHPCWFGRELFGELRGLRSDADLWNPIHEGTHPVTKVDAIGNIPPRAGAGLPYQEADRRRPLAGGPVLVDNLPLDPHSLPVVPRPRHRRRTTT
ncbi:NTP transferase domain-containing protein [Kribbella sp. HUAS MG21]|uniref:NTP transferase domain-containing protein n=1 Tax=Kribbella sp. HUAS MG21 TaxID=3160966 RepID=A0AAU7TPH4_9ACTN